MIKRIPYLVLGLVCCVTFAFGQQPPTFTVSPQNLTVDPNDDFSVDITVDDYIDFITFQYTLRWDPTILEFQSVSDVNGTDFPTFSPSGIGTNNAVSQGTLTASWFESNLTPITVPNGTAVFTINFTAIGSGPTTIAFTEDPPGIEVIDANEENVGLIPQDATITVTGDVVGGNTDPLGVSTSSASGQNGTTVCLPIRVTNFDDVTGFEFSINYDPAVLNYSNLQNFGLMGLDGTDFMVPPSTSEGQIGVSWSNAAGTTVSDNTVIAEVCFDIVGTAPASSTVSFTGMPTAINVTTVASNGMDVGITPSNATVTVMAQGGGDGGPLVISAGSATGEPGTEVCIPVTVSNFNEIINFQYSINYNSAVLSFNGAQNFNLMGLNSSAFANETPGSIAVSWLDDNIAGITLPDNTVIFELCFSLINGGTSTIVFSGNPTSIEVTTVESEGTNVGLTGNSGQIISEGDVVLDGLAFIASSATVQPNEEFCVDVTVNDFTDLISFQYSMSWDPTIVEFTGVQGFNVPDLENGSFGTSNVDNGALTVSWTDNTTLGIDVPNGETIFQICFIALGNVGQSTGIIFGSNPTNVEVIDSGENELIPDLNGGIITIADTPPGEDVGLSVNPPAQAVAIGDNFCMPLSVISFNNITDMQFTVNYPSDLIQFSEAQITGNLPGLGNGQIDSSTPGQIIVNWTAPNGSETLANGTVILNLCFTVLQAGPNNMATISFSNESINNEDGAVINLMGPTVNIPLGNPPTIFPIQAEITCAQPGEQVCVTVSSANFDNLISIQHTISFDPAILSYESINIEGNLPDLAMSGFGTTNVNSGNITFSWFKQDVQGVTVADNTPFYNICFTVLGNAGDSSPFAFTENSATYEIIDEDENELEWLGQDGAVNIETTCEPISCAFTADVVDVDCNGGSNGSINLNLDGCEGANFAWSNGAGNNAMITELPVGNYTVTVTIGGSQMIETYEVNEPSVVNIASATPTDVSCFGDMDGSILLSVSGGTENGDYTYSFSPSNATTNPATGLSPDTYAVTVTDDNGCMTTMDNIIVSGPAEALSVSTSNITDIVCGGDATGAITVEGAGGTSAYSFNWGNGVTGATRNDLTAGLYTVTVTDANGCTVVETFTVQTLNTELTISNIMTTPITGAGNNGAISVSAGGGSGTFDFLWMGPNFTSMNQNSITGLNEAGVYNVTITDSSSGCTASASATLDAPLAINEGATVVNNTCFGETTGTIDITTTGGSGDYTYLWSPDGQTTEDISGLDVGDYTVTITDTNNTTIITTASFSVETTPEIIVNEDISADTGIGNGSIDLDISGGIGPFVYEWSPDGQTTEDLSDQNTGLYTVTITDTGSDCIVVQQYEIPFVDTPLGLAVIEVQGVSCNGFNDGEVTIMIEGGSPDYTITFDCDINEAQPIFDNGSSQQIFTGFGGGSCNITITDAAGNPFTQEFIVPEPDAIVLEATTDVFDVINTINCDGAINLEISGGIEDYSYMWSNGSTAEDPGQLCPNIYNVTVTDDNECTVVFTDFIVKEFTIQADQSNVTEPSCPESTNGSIVLSVINGSMPYNSITWTDASTGIEVGTGLTLSGVPEGTYIAMVRDADNRTITQEFTLTASSSLTASAFIETSYNGFGVSCADATDATIRVTPNGSGSYTYMWSDGLGTNPVVTNAFGGLHTVTVTEQGSGCQTEAMVMVTAPLSISIDLDVLDIDCHNENDGELVAFASGGVSGFNYRWSNGRNGPSIFNLEGDTYTVTVTDQNGCKVDSTKIITNPDSLVIVTGANPITDTEAGSATVFVAGGTMPYEYEWMTENNIISNQQTVEGITKEGRYIVIVTDDHGCSEVGVVDVDILSNCLKSRPVITPQEDGGDGDGLNDNFVINCIENYPGNHLEIYNRWGQMVFEADDYDDSWEGTNRRGQPLPEGGYFYVLTYDDASGQLVQLKGSLSILRN